MRRPRGSARPACICGRRTTSARELLDGSNTYRLRVPPDVPAKQFWAVTVYDLETAGFIRESPRVELNSFDENVVVNDDGSVDVYFGPSALEAQRSNWVYTAPGKHWFAAFRFYGPLPSADREDVDARGFRSIVIV